MFPIRDFFIGYTNDIISIFKNSTDRPYNVYLTQEINNFLNDSDPFKGILVIESQKYYSGGILTELSNTVNDIGFFVSYEYSDVDFSQRPTLSFNTVFNFDFNPDIDHYGAMTLREIDWFVNRHQDYFKDYSLDGCYICSLFNYVSKPIYRIEGGVSSFIRRSVLFTFKVILCGS